MLFKSPKRTAASKPNPKIPREKQYEPIVIILVTSIFTIIGTVVGALVNSSIHRENEINKRRVEAVINSSKFDSSTSLPKEFHDLKMLADAMQNAASFDDKLMRELINLAKAYPGCQMGPDALSTRCKPHIIKSAIAARIAAGGSELSHADMEIFLNPRIDSAKAAFEKISGTRIP